MVFLLFLFLSLAVVVLTIPPIIAVTFKKGWFEAAFEKRKLHKGQVSHFGGIAIFLGIMIPNSLNHIDLYDRESYPYIFSLFLIFLLGLKDDINSLRPQTKLFVQGIAVLITVISGDLRIPGLEKIMPLLPLNYGTSMMLTIVFVLCIVNAMNLIDGINGLAGSLFLMQSLVFAFLFYHSGAFGLCCFSLSCAGAILGFLYFNVFAAKKIFMGDCGSLVLGYISAILSIRLLNIGIPGQSWTGLRPMATSLSLVIALLSIPLFDTLRVFTLRVLQHKSPFRADDNHLHHRLLKIGLSQLQATGLLVLINSILVWISLWFQDLGDIFLILMISLILLILNGLLTLRISLNVHMALKKQTG